MIFVAISTKIVGIDDPRDHRPVVDREFFSRLPSRERPIVDDEYVEHRPNRLRSSTSSTRRATMKRGHVKPPDETCHGNVIVVD